MAVPERVPTSKRLRNAASAERGRLVRELQRAERQASALHRDLLRVEEVAIDIRRQLGLLAQLAYDEEEHSPFAIGPTLRPVSDESNEPLPSSRQPRRGYLAGADIRMAAVRILASSEDPSRPIHYTDWYCSLVDAGFGVAGKDPVAAFLTQIGRSPVVSRASERGVYALDFSALDRLRANLHELHNELIRLHEGQQTIDAIASTRELRAQLTASCARIERALEEAAQSLGTERALDQISTT